MCFDKRRPEGICGGTRRKTCLDAQRPEGKCTDNIRPEGICRGRRRSDAICLDSCLEEICLDIRRREEICLDTLRQEGICPGTRRPKGHMPWHAVRTPYALTLIVWKKRLCFDTRRPEG